MEQTQCQFCHTPLSESFYFCPNCGKKIKEHFSTSFWKQTGIYALSVLLPPLGLYPGFKYLKGNDPKVKMIGVIAIVLTIISTVLTLWLTFEFVKQASDAASKQMNQLQGF